ncbi:unnamed protein product [Dovyalis caffra]|uniref:Uncharacterized protein n=1 Tax=Dovyalis caffra TaxID=77055 RepID=A0AAV1QXM2_9ROSI|nr:unnamed protein product [Dovyalis caffra]
MEGQSYPYTPTDLKLLGYVPNFLTQSTINFTKTRLAHYPIEVWKEYSKGDSRYTAKDAWNELLLKE